MKPFTEERMKLEPFPWLQDYLINMDELYTKLTLEKLDNTRFGETGKTLGNYKEIFKSGLQGKANCKTEKEKENSLKGKCGNGKVNVGEKNRARLGPESV